MSIVGGYIKYNGGLLGAAKKLLVVIATLIRTRGLYGIYIQWMETRSRMRQLDYEESRVTALAIYTKSRILRIISTQHTAYVAYMLDVQFCKYGIVSEIIFDLQHKPDNNALYLVICPQMVAHIPRHMIAFQMEQSTSKRWFTPKYIKLLSQSIAVLDYSSFNLKYLQELGLNTSNLYLYPVHPLSTYKEYLGKRGINFETAGDAGYDVVFYGDAECERRKIILTELSKRFRLKIISEVFSSDLYSALLCAKVVLNIHYYAPALLETTRISECVSLGIPVVSELGMSGEDHEEFGGLVRYVPVGDIDAMSVEIVSLLNGSKHEGPSYQAQEEQKQVTDLSTARFLVGCGLIAPSELLDKPSDITLKDASPVCLSLPETPLRRMHAQQSCVEQPKYFDGLRHVQGWKGCALSYWYLAIAAKRQGLNQLEVYEDDCQFYPGSLDALKISRRYLHTQSGEWDVFSGLITSINEGVQIVKVEIFEGIKFVHLNKTLGTVYSIFNNTIYNHLTAWDVSDSNAASNTIDKYIASKPGLRVITCLPYIVGHAEGVESTLWGFGNQAYNNLLEISQHQLDKLVSEFEEFSKLTVKI